ncbi:MAG: hypothetical protein KDC44_23065, partial [Phaeodactylibacter sp.]|nr:hypothetical protein [Phaeodactylibacter sp.]
ATFASAGIFKADLPADGLEKRAYNVHLYADGSILLGGTRNYDGNVDYDPYLIKLLPDGSLDMSFGDQGWTSYGTSATQYCYTMSVGADVKILVAGFQQDAGSGGLDGTVSRFFPNGDIDTDFSGFEGNVTIDDGGANETVYGVVGDANGNVYAVGTRNERGLLAKLLTNGLSDNSWNGDGIALLESDEGNVILRDAVLTPDNHLLVVGNAGDKGIIAKYNPDGGLNQEFGTATLAGTTLVDFWSDQPTDLVDIKLASNGDILVTGTGTYDNLDDDIITVVLNADGTFKNDFGQMGEAFFHQGNTDFGAASAWDADEEKIVTVGVVNGDLAVIRHLAPSQPSALHTVAAAVDALQLSPNPATAGSAIQLDYELQESSLVQVTLQAIDSRQLNRLLNTEQQAGTQSETLILPNDLPAGLYTLQIRTDLGLSTLRLMVE